MFFEGDSTFRMALCITILIKRQPKVVTPTLWLVLDFYICSEENDVTGLCGDIWTKSENRLQIFL